MEAVVRVEGVSKTFGAQRVLDRINLDLFPGEVHAFAGANGAGKSTLIKILTGYHLPDPGGGQISVGGAALSFGDTAAIRAQGVTWVHQGNSVIDEMSAADNLGLISGFRTRGGKVDRAAQADHARQELGRLGVELDPNLSLRQLGPVERTVVAIAGALAATAGGAKLLILDEPTAALPGPEVERLFALIKRIRDNGTSILYVSHRLGEVMQLADRVSVIRDGKMAMTAAIGEITQEDLVGAITGAGDGMAMRAAEGTRLPGADPTRPVVLSVGGLRTRLIESASFELREGEVLGVCGIAGSGRDELLGGLAQALPSTAGSLSIAGEKLEDPGLAAVRKAGLVYAPGNRRPGSASSDMTLRENITLPAILQYRRSGRVSRSLELRDTKRWIRETDLTPRDPERAFALLSGGNQQKAILAKWFNVEPKVVLLDEPTAGVDVAARESIYALIREQAERGVAFILASADDEEIVKLCGRVIVFANGRIAAELEGDEVTEFNVVKVGAGVGAADRLTLTGQ